MFGLEASPVFGGNLFRAQGGREIFSGEPSLKAIPSFLILGFSQRAQLFAASGKEVADQGAGFCSEKERLGTPIEAQQDGIDGGCRVEATSGYGVCARSLVGSRKEDGECPVAFRAVARKVAVGGFLLEHED